MAVVIETSVGELVINLFTIECPLACFNFLKLCKNGCYNNCLFNNLQRNFLIRTEEAKTKSHKESSIYGLLYQKHIPFFDHEIRSFLRHRKRGIIGMASKDRDCNGSAFYITLPNFPLDSLDEQYSIFGEVSEGKSTLELINESVVDNKFRPIQNILIKRIVILEDPFPDLPGLSKQIYKAPPEIMEISDCSTEDECDKCQDERSEKISCQKESESRAIVLEMIGDLPDANVKPLNNVLFICKLNPVTTAEDLGTIFGQCGKVVASDIIRDWKTGESLNYGFIGFEEHTASVAAYFKMNNAIIDGRRIKVDFSQSVAHLWKHFKNSI